MHAALDKMKSFLLSDVYAIVVFLLAYGFVAFDRPIGALCSLVVLCLLIIFFSDDMIPMLLPLFLILCVAHLCVWELERMEWVFWVFLPLAVAALLYRFIRGLRSLRIGSSFSGLIAVTAAVTLGGIFSISAEEYFSFASLYYIFGLGALSLFVYVIFKGNAGVRRSYAVADKVASAMYLMAIFLSFMILRILVMYPEILNGKDPVTELMVSHAVWRNSAANLAVMAMPFIFYYARRHHPIHLLSVLFVYMAVVISGSRGGLVIGAIQIVICFFAYIWHKPKWRMPMLLLFASAAALAILFHDPIIEFFETYLRFTFDKSAVESEARYLCFFRAIEDFASAPLFGTGLGYVGNADIYVPLMDAWQIYWYHSLFSQIVGSLGLFGLAAYGYQLHTRLCTLRAMPRTPYAEAIGLSYIGALLYSQIDPGIFVPIPFSVLVVLLFVLAECEGERHAKKEKKDPA